VLGNTTAHIWILGYMQFQMNLVHRVQYNNNNKKSIDVFKKKMEHFQ